MSLFMAIIAACNVYGTSDQVRCRRILMHCTMARLLKETSHSDSHALYSCIKEKLGKHD